MTHPRTLLRTLSVLALAAASVLGLSTAIRADEGMWTYEHPPVQLIQKRFGFTPTQAWLDHLRLSSTGIGGGSGSFVSPDGLILTNHHVARMYLQQLSTPQHNYVENGFYAKTLADEMKVPGAMIEVLVSMQEVTPEVDAAVKPGATPAQAQQARDAEMARIEKECLAKTGLHGKVVPLYGGARYMLYRYKEYTDVRVVMAPEEMAAYFGGDADNFYYPRYDIDFSFLRVYENGKPAHTPDYLQFDPAGVTDGMPIFVSGHPGRTDRLDTLAQLAYFRDDSYPAMLSQLAGLDAALTAYGKKGPEQAQEAQSMLFFIHNAIKAITGEYDGLKDPALMAEKASQEKALRAAVEKDPKLRHYADAWKQIENAVAWERAHFKEITYEGQVFDGYGLTGTAMNILRYAEEVKKPDGERLDGYHDSQIPGLLRRLEAPRPYYKGMSQAVVAYELTTLRDQLGPGDPFVKSLLQGKTPEQRAAEAVQGTRLGDAAYRASLLKNDGAAVKSCKDPLIAFVRLMDPTLRRVHKAVKDNVEAVVQPALTEIAKAQFAVYGDKVYPDATGTLRLAFGTVKGYSFDTSEVPYKTTFYGLYDRAYSFDNKGDFQLSKMEEAKRDQLDLKTPMDFVCTADITGGNSGSPIVDKEGKLVGLVFDGNPQSNPNTFVYSEKVARCVAVDTPAIMEALTKLYGADRVVQELTAAAKGQG